MIDGHHALSISRQAQLADISRGSVYYLPKPVSAADLALLRHVDVLHVEHPFMQDLSCMNGAAQPIQAAFKPGIKKTCRGLYRDAADG